MNQGRKVTDLNFKVAVLHKNNGLILMKKLFFLCIFLLSASVQAATYSTTLIWNNSNYSENFGGNVFGTNLKVGNSFEINNYATGNDYWDYQKDTGYFWAIAGVTTSGSRFGDTTYSFYNNGVLLFKRTVFNGLSQSIGVGAEIYDVPKNLIYDQWSMTYLLLGTNKFNNVLSVGIGGYLDANYLDTTSVFGGSTYIKVSEVPLPASILLLFPTLISFLYFRRSKKRSSSCQTA